MLGFFILVLLFLAFFLLSFLFAFEEWLRPTAVGPLQVDVDYIRVETYFGAALRKRLSEQPTHGTVASRATRAAANNSTGGGTLIFPESILNGKDDRAVLYCEGDLNLASGATVPHPTYCRGDLTARAGVCLRSLAADGAVLLGNNNQVEQWVDTKRKVTLRKGTTVGSRVTSMECIELEQEVSVQSLYAPRIITIPNGGRSRHRPSASSKQSVRATANARPACLEGKVFFTLSPGTFLVPGDLLLDACTVVEANLVVRGALRAGADCSFLGNLKAAAVQIGPGTHLAGNLVSAGDVILEEDCSITCCVLAAGNVRIASGVQIGRPNSEAVVSAGREIIIQDHVVIYGKVAAGRVIRTT